MAGGRKPDPKRVEYAKRLGVKITNRHRRRLLSQNLMRQLDGCKDDAARRLILGTSKMTKFPKPKDVPKEMEAVHVFRNGREVCAPNPEGRREYLLRRRSAWDRQRGLCGICQKHLDFEDAVSDHIEPRGMDGGKRDDRQSNIQAVCWTCNTEKGSKRGYK